MATTAAGTPYVEASDLVAGYPAVSLALANHIDETGGKVLQVVRATDVTDRSTTSTAFVDASISITITPQRVDSIILIIWNFLAAPNANERIQTQITDSGNTALSGAEASSATSQGTFRSQISLIGYSTPATLLATTYKGRFKSTGGANVTIAGSTTTGQLFAIEVAA